MSMISKTLIPAVMLLGIQCASATDFYKVSDLKAGVQVIGNIFSITYHTPWGLVLMTEQSISKTTWYTIERTMLKDWTNPSYAVESVKVGNESIIRSGLHMYTVRGTITVDYGAGTDKATYSFMEVISNAMGSPKIEQLVVSH